MVNLVNLLVFFWLLGFAVFSGVQLSKRNIKCIYFIYIIHFMFCGFPLFLDVLLGPPEYREQPGYAIACSDMPTFYIYCSYVSFVPVLWSFTAIGSSSFTPTTCDYYCNTTPHFGFFSILTYCAALFLPFLLVAASPEPEQYLTYGMIAIKRLPQNIIDHHGYVAASTLIGLLGIAGILLRARRINIILLGISTCLTLCFVWIDGKRAIVTMAMLIYLYVFLARGCLRGRRLFTACSISLLFLMVYSGYYQNVVRNEVIGLIDYNDKYENVRIDYGRDAVIRFTIYSELHHEYFLDYRGQSVLFNFVFFVPRSMWPNKPWPYSVYLTAAMLFRNSPEPIGWGMTTSWLEEAIANFSWAGVLIGPLLLSLVCRLGDQTSNRSTQALGVLLGALLLAVQLSAFMPLALLWISMVLKERCMKGPHGRYKLRYKNMDQKL